MPANKTVQEKEQPAPKKEAEKTAPPEKTSFERIELLVKIVTVVSIVVGVYSTLRQFSINVENQRVAAAREYQKSFYQAQMDVYAEAVSATSQLATTTPASDAYNEARRRFLQLFWGRMSMFEDKCVESRMVEFRRLLIKFEQQDFSKERFVNPCSPNPSAPDVCVIDTVTQVLLKLASLRLAHQCRIYTIKTWLPAQEQQSYNLIDSTPCPHN